MPVVPRSELRPDLLWGHVHALGMLAAQGTFTAAAQRLGLSKAAMSQRIAELERVVGVPLVQRTTRSVRLTEAGQQLVDETAPAYAQIERGFHGVRERAEAPRGLIRLTAPVALGRQQVVPHLASFLRAHAEVRIELDLSDRLLPLAQEGVDLAIRHTAQPPDTHVAWLLCETRTLLVGAPAYLRRHGIPEHPTALADHACLGYPRPGAAPVWSFEHRKGERVAVPVRGPLAANNSEVLREAVLDGLGLALLPDFSAQAALRSRKLTALLPQWRAQGSFGERLYAIRPYSPVVPKAVRALVEHLRAALAGGFAA